MEDARATPDIDLCFDQHVSDMFNTLLGGLPGVLPDAHFLVNHLDEPRVVILPAGQKPSIECNTTNLSGQPTWDALTEFCPPWYPPPPNASLTHGLPFITNLTASLDLSANPFYSTTHGLFTAPASFSLIRGPIPVLHQRPLHYTPHSPTNPTTSPGRGSTTGGIAHPYTTSDSPSWKTALHRQRFLSLTQNLSPGPTPHLPPRIPLGSGTITPFQTPFLNTRLYNTHPAQITGCSTPLACRQQLSHFRTRPRQFRTAPLHSNSPSTSTATQSVLREWHADRVRPWVHYVPVPVGMGELPETGWLLGKGRGEGVARAIGEGRAEWMGRAGREVDAGIYLWRVLLEVGRVGERGRGG
ncbi:hypothetical protein C8A05DRAFT_37071 [Staphylotrichum tortipilum]|uniref:Glycosyl transferase CAP10 domain-containing protein n=1 Tax=Staphylotrichum tortipilum TaxID=2831512 RepID=A0AAN6MFS8_9PEZI|nr:hypothetical protein C8A05DRAFT_37071 [Staphylotrichum longicolle]